MSMVDRLRELWNELPMAHRVVMGASVAIVTLAVALFARWVSTPTFAVLYAGMDNSELSSVIDELEGMGVPFRLEGSSVMVPRATLLDTRARLAGAGIVGTPTAPGYELLDAGGLSVSDFKQQIDLKRAIEGEWARTISSLDGVRSAQVHIVIPEDELFREATEPAKASVLVDPSRTLTGAEIETIVVLISGGVDGLSPSDVTVADTAGNVLNLPDGTGGSFSQTNRSLQATRAYEAALAGKALSQLEAIVGAGRASVTVNAVLNFDESSTETESYAPDSSVALREQTVDESYTGAGTPPGGTVGVEGGPQATADSATTDYQRTEETREYGVDRTVNRTVQAPGTPERLSVAVTVDDGSLTGASVPDAGAIEQLVAAAVGLDTKRGDTIEVLSHPFQAPADDAVIGGGVADMMSIVPQILGGLTLLLVAAALFLMSRGRKDGDEITWLPAPAPTPAISGGAVLAGGEQPALVGAVSSGGASAVARELPSGNSSGSVTALADRQPDQVAALLRSWLMEDEL